MFSLIRADKHKVYKCNKCSLLVRPGTYPPILAYCITAYPSFPLSKFHSFLDSNSPHMRVMTAFTCLTWRNFIRHKTLKWRRRPLRVKWAFSLIVLFYCIDPVHDRVLVNRRSLRHHRHLGSLDLHLHLGQQYIFGVRLSYNVGVLVFLFDFW